MSNKKEFIPALGYDWLTIFYDLAIKITMPEKKFRAILIDELNPDTKDTILEFGFGTGQNIIYLLKGNSNIKLIGVDIDPKIKRIAEYKLKKLGLKVQLDLYDGHRLPYKDNTFDKIYSSFVFHQLDKDTKFLCLKELHRVLKPGGHLIIGDWGKSQNWLMRFSFYVVQILDGFKTTNDSVKGLLPKYIEQAGFKNVIESGFLNTKIGTFSYYKASKNI